MDALERGSKNMQVDLSVDGVDLMLVSVYIVCFGQKYIHMYGVVIHQWISGPW